MHNIYIILIMAIIGGIIGYVTNKLAIKLIFRPINPIKIPILNIEIIGLIPKRRKEIAIKIGEVIQDEFISLDDILENLISEEDKAKVTKYIKIKVNSIIEEKATLIPSYIKSVIKNYIEDIIEKEVSDSIDELGSEVVSKAHERVNIQQIVEEKIDNLDLLELENIILSIASNELKHIELLGLILGFIIGIIQGIITIFI